MSDVNQPTMITIKSKSKPDTDKVAVNGSTADKRLESAPVKLHKDVQPTADHSAKNGAFGKDDYRNSRTTGSFYRSNRVLVKNRSYNGEHGSRKYYDDVPKKRDESFDSRSMYYNSYRSGK